MKKSFKFGMLAGTSAAAFGLVLAASQAQAFDEVNWTWDAHIDETITKTVIVDINLDPTGMVMLEDLQVSIGDLTATSQVNDVFNNQPGEAIDTGGTVEFAVDWDTEGGRGLLSGFPTSETNLYLDPNGNVVFIDPMTGVESFATVIDCEGGATATFCTSMGQFIIAVEVEGELVPIDSFDALTELPEVISAATAVANNTAIETDTSVQLHEGQFAFGDGDVDFDSTGEVVGLVAAGALAGHLAHQGVNSNLIGAGTVGTMAILGLLEKAEISADSQVGNIHNATVDSSATAVANNLTVDIEAVDDDRLLIGDAVQFSYANLDAMSDVRGVYINNYTNLGSLDRAIVNSVATAVGNNKSITVRAPSVDVGNDD